MRGLNLTMRSERRQTKLRRVLERRQPDLTVVLENVHDPHNVSAILRSADAVGICQVQLVYTSEKYPRVGKKSSASAGKWLGRRKFSSIEECYRVLRGEGFKVYATSLTEGRQTLYDLDLTKKVGLVFGNEHRGVSDDTARLSDGVFIIPMMGMIQSLNVSVACAVSLYEALRQRLDAGHYRVAKYTLEELEKLREDWLQK